MSQIQAPATMNETSLQSSEKRKRGRPKKTQDIEIEAVASNLQKVPPPVPVAPAMTEEDMAFERELQRLHRETPPVEYKPSGVDEFNLAKEEAPELLSEAVEGVKAAATINDLIGQVQMAKQYGCSAVEASPAIVKHFCKRDYPEVVGYFMYDSIRVYIEGRFQKNSSLTDKTVEQALFGK